MQDSTSWKAIRFLETIHSCLRNPQTQIKCLGKAAKEMIPNPHKQTANCFKHSKGELRQAITEQNQAYSKASNSTNNERLKDVL
jgi:hypothetical protein